MIFLTVGTQLPFDRLVQSIDELSGEINWPIIAQVADGKYKPKGFVRCVNHLTQNEYESVFQQAKVIVSHAGMGSIISARLRSKPVIVMPRRHDFGEHRNDHQIATCRKLNGINGLFVVEDKISLLNALKAAENYQFEDQAFDGNVNSFVKNLRDQIFVV